MRDDNTHTFVKKQEYENNRFSHPNDTNSSVYNMVVQQSFLLSRVVVGSSIVQEKGKTESMRLLTLYLYPIYCSSIL